MNFPKVELHVHLDGALQHRTILELLKEKNLPLPGDGSLEALVDTVTVHQPKDLNHFLQGFSVFIPAIVGDLEAIERMAVEFCRRQAEEGVVYTEVRYCPQLLLPQNLTPDYMEGASPNTSNGQQNVATLTPAAVVEAVNRGLARGEAETGLVCRSILSCIRGVPQWSNQILELCLRYRHQGVVGIDIAGNESGAEPIPDEDKEGRMLDQEDVEAFRRAAELGIHRTVHAGEAGPAMMVLKALDVLGAERIGHGYRVLEDETIYRRCLQQRVHFECCPTSSLMTGSVRLDAKTKDVHPMIRFAKDGASYSINTDDPTITNTYLNDEYRLVTRWGLTQHDLQQANINAMEASFAEPELKARVLRQLRQAYGLSSDEL